MRKARAIEFHNERNPHLFQIKNSVFLPFPSSAQQLLRGKGSLGVLSGRERGFRKVREKPWGCSLNPHLTPLTEVSAEDSWSALQDGQCPLGSPTSAPGPIPSDAASVSARCTTWPRSASPCLAPPRGHRNPHSSSPWQPTPCFPPFQREPKEMAHDVHGSLPGPCWLSSISGTR